MESVVRSRSLIICVVALGMLMASCRSSPPKAPSKGEAFVGPSTLNLRREIPTQSPTVVTVKHGDKLQIIEQQHNSFLKVRAPNGAEGWTDQRQLLGAADMAGLKALAARAAGMPSQGKATTDADLRIHIQPGPNAPSFLTLKENDKVDVLTHIRRPRTDLPRKPLVTPPPKKAKATRKTPKNAPVPPPPMPAPPAPPPNWLEMSKGEDAAEEPVAKNEAPAGPTDDWSLVRTADGQSGWALTRRLRPAIPDEVAQYAEGHTIVSYFSLGSVRDGDQQKDTWLWTTVAGGGRPFDFDSLRVFVWSVRRHRYETEYIEKNLTGYSPVEISPVQFGGEQYAGFSVCVEKKDGNRYRRHYAVLNTKVRFANEEPCVLPPPVDFGNPGPAPAASAATPPPAAESFTQRMKRSLKSLTGGWLGR